MMSSRMRTAGAKKIDITSAIKEKFKSVFFSAQGMPIILCLITIAILFVLFRMKGIEMNYQITTLDKDVEKVRVEGKELKAKKAKMLSINNLRKMAKAHDLAQPKQNQIIVIP